MAQQSAVETVKELVAQQVRALHPRLIEISHTIHDNPELLFQEHKAVALLTEELRKDGFAVERPVAGLDTAFVASFGRGKPAVAFLAEYDALPGLGHACGHNLMAVWALGAGLALKRALPDLEGTIQVIGTPAEEGGGGKVIMGNAGVFRGLDAAFLLHPKDDTLLEQGFLAMNLYRVEFFGKSAHAAASPEEGISALDAVLQLFFSVNAWRQMLKSDARIHGSITHGGDAPNIIPEYAAAKFILRAREQAYLDEMDRRFRSMVEGASLATGARSRLTVESSYSAMASNPTLTEQFRQNMEMLGIQHVIPPANAGTGSSDICNVSQLVPTIQPLLKVTDRNMPLHSPEFARATAEEVADQAIVTGCTLLAWTAADVLLRPDVRGQARDDFRRQVGRDPQE
jgi:amidohydrolase